MRVAVLLIASPCLVTHLGAISLDRRLGVSYDQLLFMYVLLPCAYIRGVPKIFSRGGRWTEKNHGKVCGRFPEEGNYSPCSRKKNQKLSLAKRKETLHTYIHSVNSPNSAGREASRVRRGGGGSQKSLTRE